ncbi:MAG TPA: cytochrome c peroxidase [Tepidisphaeraceae bacterium]
MNTPSLRKHNISLLLALAAAAAVFMPALAQEASDDSPTTAPTTRRVDDAELRRLAAELRAMYVKPPAEWPAAEVDPSVTPIELGLVPPAPHPDDNPFSKEKAALGQRLFLDPRLSGSGQLTCASCHDPEQGWSNARSLAFGHDRSLGRRASPTLMNIGHATSLFWDGRAMTLEEQALMPVVDTIEMNADTAVVEKRLNDDPELKEQFKTVFNADTIDMENVAKAIACFERTITSGRSRFDRFVRGAPNALEDDAVRGLHLFRTKAGCMNCHHGPNMTDNQFHDLGLSFYGRKLQDLGRYEVTKKAEDVGKFKTPTLRNIGNTAPYMHTGQFELDGVLNLYNAGMPTLKRKPEQENDPLFPTKSHLLKPLELTAQEKSDLKAFLMSLNEPRQRVRER